MGHYASEMGYERSRYEWEDDYVDNGIGLPLSCRTCWAEVRSAFRVLHQEWHKRNE